MSLKKKRVRTNHVPSIIDSLKKSNGKSRLKKRILKSTSNENTIHFNRYPTSIYLFKAAIETPEKGVKYFQGCFKQ